MKVYIGADHGGFTLKEKVKAWLQELGYAFEDCGNLSYDETDDYPDYALAVGEKVAADQGARGILLCRSAAGVLIAANKVSGIRAASAFNPQTAVHAREHNDANILALSGDWISEEQAKEIIKSFLQTEYSREKRHDRRIAKIKDYEKKNIS